MRTLRVKVKNRSSFELPSYATAGSAGMDLRANISEPVKIGPLERKLIPTGIFIELPPGYEAQIRPRSGMAYKFGLTVLNSPGTIDSDYRGEIKVLMVNLSSQDYAIQPGERIAQMVVARYDMVEWEEVHDIGQTPRQEGGFGSTGKR